MNACVSEIVIDLVTTFNCLCDWLSKCTDVSIMRVPLPDPADGGTENLML